MIKDKGLSALRTLYKLITTIMPVILYLTPVNGQHFYTGIRIGASYWLAKYGIAGGPKNPANNSKFSFDGELFARKDFRNKKWAAELSLNYTPFSNSFWKTNNTYFNGYNVIKKVNNIYFYEADITVLYDVSSPLPGYFISYLNRMKSSIGFSLIPTYQKNHEAYLLENSQKQSVWYDTKDSRFTAYVGISYNHFLPLTRHIVANTVLALRYNPFDGYVDDNHEVAYPNMRISWETGICYKW